MHSFSLHRSLSLCVLDWMLFLTKNSQVYYLVDASCVMFDWFPTNDDDGRGMWLRRRRRGSSTTVQEWGDKLQHRDIALIASMLVVVATHQILVTLAFLAETFWHWFYSDSVASWHNWTSLTRSACYCLRLSNVPFVSLLFNTFLFAHISTNAYLCGSCAFAALVFCNNCLTDQVKCCQQE